MHKLGKQISATIIANLPTPWLNRTVLGTEAIAKYLGKEHKFVVDELHEATATITQLRQQNHLLFRQTKHLNARLQRIEALFKQTAG